MHLSVARISYLVLFFHSVANLPGTTFPYSVIESNGHSQKSLHLTPTSLPPKPLLISQIKSLLAPAFPILSEPSPNAVASGSGGGGGLGLGDDDDDDGDGGGGGEAARLREYREKYLTDEPRREVEGLGQILFVEGRCVQFPLNYQY